MQQITSRVATKIARPSVPASVPAMPGLSAVIAAAQAAAIANACPSVPPVAPAPALPPQAAKPVANGGASVQLGVLVNPKKPGSASHARFQLYAAHRTAAGYVAACVALGQPNARRNAVADLVWDAKHGFIVLGQPEVW